MATAPQKPIRTFSDAAAVLREHGQEPTPAGNKLWSVGPYQLDKGGVIAKARELADTPAPARTDLPAEAAAALDVAVSGTDLDTALKAQIEARGWRWLHAARGGDGVWQHTIQLAANPQVEKRLDLAGLRQFCGLASETPVGRNVDQERAQEVRRHIVAGDFDAARAFAKHVQDSARREQLYAEIREAAAHTAAPAPEHRAAPPQLATHPTSQADAPLPPRGNPATQAPDLAAMGWSFEHAVMPGRGGWIIGNRTLGIGETIVAGSLETAILEARTQQAAKIGYVRPPETPEHTTVPLYQIVPGRWQPRQSFDQAALDELAESIVANGLLNPPLVFWNERGQYELIAGERRWRAAQLANLDAIPVQVLEGTPAQLQAAAVLDNIQREDLSPVEEGQAYQRLIDELDVSENELSKRLGKPRTYIQVRRMIAAAAPEVHAALADGKLSITQARAIAAGAPGDHPSQVVAAKAVRELVETGQRCSEAEAQRKAERAVLARHKRALKKLGWQIQEPGDYSMARPILWSAADRPREWTPGQMIEAVRDGIKPGLAPIVPPELTAEAEAVLERAGSTVDTKRFAPWVKIVSVANGTAEYLDADGLAAKVEAARQEIAALEARFAAAGWRLKWGGGENWAAESALGRSERGWRWHGAIELIVRIEAGAVPPEPAVERERLTTCADCQQQVSQTYWQYEDSSNVCGPCRDARDRARAETRAAMQQAVLAAGADWIAQVPDLLLRLLVMDIDQLVGHPVSYRRSRGRADLITTKSRDELLALWTAELTATAAACAGLDLGAEQAREVSA